MLHAFDIETSGLDPRTDVIVSVAFTTGTGEHVVLTGGEEQLLRDLEALVWDLSPGVLVTWNGAVFDLPFVQSRASMLRVPLSLRMVPDPQVKVKYAPVPGHRGGYRAAWGPHRHVDIAGLYEQTAGDAGVRWGLKPVARLFGIEVIELDRERIGELIDRGREAEVVAYNCSDSDATMALAVRLGADLDGHVDRL